MAFRDEVDKVNWSSEDRELVLRLLLMNLELKHNLTAASDSLTSTLTWSNGDIKWIKSDSVFVAFSKKTQDDDLLSDVHKALCDWSPLPSRLFLNKLRADMDEYGIAAQSTLLDRRSALAFWYYRLLQTDDQQERRWRIAESVERHSDRLMTVILPRIEEFATHLINEERKIGEPAVVCRAHFGMDLANNHVRKKAAVEHNALVCSKRPEGWHLTTGHIFLLHDKQWLCVSPACDMVPAQVPNWRKEQFGDCLPFFAVELKEEDSPETLLKNVHDNRSFFLHVDGGIKGYSFNSQRNAAPKSYLFFARNRGRFSENSFQFSVYEAKWCEDRLIFRCHFSNVVAQLRYEYALNLVQRLGAHFTRIGLDFVNDRQLQQ